MGVPIQAPPGQFPASQQQLGEVPVDGSVQRANAGYAAPGQSVLGYNIDQVSVDAGAVVIPLYSPAPGEIFFVTDINLSHSLTAGLVRFALVVGTGVVGGVVTNGVTVWSSPCRGANDAIQLAGLESQPSCAAGLTMYLVASQLATAKIYGNLGGVAQGAGVG